MDTIQLGNIIKNRRKEKKLTLEALSLHCNVGIRFLSEMENGKPTAEIGKVLKVMDRLNIDLTVLPTSEVHRNKYNNYPKS